ncbi:MAG: Na+/H+ antiporter subunit E [Chlamydiota bacterium]|nr:Na+/H+ antiporter subunit E [Chlamydiota bacterium]
MKLIKIFQLLYIFLKEFILSNFSVAYTILFVSSSTLKPKLIAYDAKKLTLNERMILAQMITLTPGTITAKINEDGTLMIHVLDGKNSEEKLKGIQDTLEKALLGVTR